MTVNHKFIQRFDELEEQLRAVLATKHYKGGTYTAGDYVDTALFVSWSLKARNLISKACGEDSLHFKEFISREHDNAYKTNYDILLRLQAVFGAAREDYEGGYCTSIRSLIQSEVFDSELDQARELLNAGYLSAGAVIAGVVLETTLRQLCDDRKIPHGKLDKMNADLAKAGEYSLLKQKQITAWADIRNSAAHGKSKNFSAEDVQDVIVKVEAFVAEKLC